MGCSPSTNNNNIFVPVPPGANALIRQAIKEKNWTKVKEILTSLETEGIPLNFNKHDEHKNVLHEAISYRAPDDLLIKILEIGIPKGLDLEDQEYENCTILRAAIGKSPEVVTAILDHGAYMERGLDLAVTIHLEQVAKSESTSSVIWRSGYLRTFATLILEHLRATEMELIKRLWYAVKLDMSPDPIKKHLKDTEKFPSLLNEPDRNGDLLLHKACANKHYPKENLEMVTFLLDLGADVNARQGREDWTPLHVAAHNGVSLFVVQRLLEKGADPKAMDINGKTPLHLAMKANEPHLFVALGGTEAPVQEAVLVVN